MVNMSFTINYMNGNKVSNKEANPNLINTTPKVSSNLEWNVTWSTSEVDRGQDIAVDSSENIYVVGHTDIIPGGLANRQLLLIKFDKEGNHIWNETIGFNEHDYGYGIAIDSKDFIYITGSISVSSDNNATLLKYDSEGEQLWNRTWGGPNSDFAFNIAIDNQDNIYITGSTESFPVLGDREMFIVKYNENGTKIREEIISTSDLADQTSDITIDKSYNIYITGVSNNSYLLVMKLNKTFDYMWNKTYGKKDGTVEYYGDGIALGSDNNIYVVGGNDSGGDADMILLKYNNSGNLEWCESWDNGSSKQVRGNDIEIDSRNYIYITGSGQFIGEHYSFILLKYNPLGKQLSSTIWEESISDYANGLTISEKNNVINIYLTGGTHAGIAQYDVYVAKFTEQIRDKIGYYYSSDDDDDDGKPKDDLLLIVGVTVLVSAIAAVTVISVILIKKRSNLKR